MPTNETGIAIKGITAARQVWRKMMTTITTRKIAIISVIDDFFEGLDDEGTGVIVDPIGESGIKPAGQFLHLVSYTGRRRHGVGSGLQRHLKLRSVDHRDRR